MIALSARVTLALVAGLGLVSAGTGTAVAGSSARHMRARQAGVHFTRGHASSATANNGYQALVSDGPGSGFGFHHIPYPLHVAAVNAHERQVAAVRSAVTTDAFTQGFNGYGFRGDSVYGEGNHGSYGVFDGPDGYGSPYFAGYYGPGEGADYGVFGHAYN